MATEQAEERQPPRHRVMVAEVGEPPSSEDERRAGAVDPVAIETPSRVVANCTPLPIVLLETLPTRPIERSAARGGSSRNENVF